MNEVTGFEAWQRRLERGLGAARHLVSLATLGIACAVGCHRTSGQQPPQVPAPSPNIDTSLTPAQLEECVQGCNAIQQNHPEESPYDCRATCINGSISP